MDFVIKIKKIYKIASIKSATIKNILNMRGVFLVEVLVLDVGGTFIKYALINENVEMGEKGKISTPMDTIESFVDVIGELFEKYKSRISGIAMSLPGRMNSDTGYLYSGGSLQYNYNINIIDILKKRCDVPISIENDGKCAALAEAKVGNLKDIDDGIVVILGTGIGGGIIKDKKLHKGKHFMAGEFSMIFSDGKEFNSDFNQFWGGQNGVPALCVAVAEAKNLPIEAVDGYKVFEYVNSGDEVSKEIFNKYCSNMAAQLFNLQYIFDPEKIAIGGGISQQSILIECIQKNIDKYADKLGNFLMEKPKVVPCKYFNDSNLIGAYFNYVNKFVRK